MKLKRTLKNLIPFWIVPLVIGSLTLVAYCDSKKKPHTYKHHPTHIVKHKRVP